MKAGVNVINVHLVQNNSIKVSGSVLEWLTISQELIGQTRPKLMGAIFCQQTGSWGRLVKNTELVENK